MDDPSTEFSKNCCSQVANVHDMIGVMDSLFNAYVCEAHRRHETPAYLYGNDKTIAIMFSSESARYNLARANNIANAINNHVLCDHCLGVLSWWLVMEEDGYHKHYRCGHCLRTVRGEECEA